MLPAWWGLPPCKKLSRCLLLPSLCHCNFFPVWVATGAFSLRFYVSLSRLRHASFISSSCATGSSRCLSVQIENCKLKLWTCCSHSWAKFAVFSLVCGIPFWKAQLSRLQCHLKTAHLGVIIEFHSNHIWSLQATSAGADIILVKKEFVAASLADGEDKTLESSKQLELETMSQKISKASGPLFGTSSSQGASKSDSTATKFAALLNDIKYATSGDDWCSHYIYGVNRLLSLNTQQDLLCCELSFECNCVVILLCQRWIKLVNTYQ